MTPSDLLRGAVKEIQTKGWMQGEDGGLCGSGSCCVWVAMVRVRQDDDSYTTAVHAMREAAGGLPLTVWNDEPGRTVEEVLATLEKMALHLEGSK